MCSKDRHKPGSAARGTYSTSHHRKRLARPSVLRGFGENHGHSPFAHQWSGTKWEAKLATWMPTTMPTPVATSGRNGTGRVRKNCDPATQEAHAAAEARWRRCRANAKGGCHGGIARELGIHRRRKSTTPRGHADGISTDAEWPMIDTIKSQLGTGAGHLLSLCTVRRLGRAAKMSSRSFPCYQTTAVDAGRPVTVGGLSAFMYFSACLLYT